MHMILVSLHKCYLLSFMLVYSIYCPVVSLLLFSPSTRTLYHRSVHVSLSSPASISP